MLLYLRLILLLWLLGGPFRLAAQRSYSMRSVLAEGNWFQVGTTSSGIYRITGSELQQMGFLLPFPSGQLRIFGRATCFLSESPGGSYSDDLAEMAISIQDGGDGQIESGDFALFYSGGPHHWVPDPVKQEFRHKLNLYSDTAFYYITAGGVGKRIENSPVYSGSVQRITSFQYRFWHEKE